MRKIFFCWIFCYLNCFFISLFSLWWSWRLTLCFALFSLSTRSHSTCRFEWAEIFISSSISKKESMKWIFFMWFEIFFQNSINFSSSDRSVLKCWWKRWASASWIRKEDQSWWMNRHDDNVLVRSSRRLNSEILLAFKNRVIFCFSFITFFLLHITTSLCHRNQHLFYLIIIIIAHF